VKSSVAWRHNHTLYSGGKEFTFFKKNIFSRGVHSKIKVQFIFNPEKEKAKKLTRRI
jgi:hypothetical protein